MRQSIRGYTDGLIGLASPTGESSLSTLASELSAVRGVIAGSDDLRRALSDPGIPVAARRGVLNDLFGSHVGAPTLRLLGFVLDADRASETVGDVEWLAERLDAAARHMVPVGDQVLGTKGAEERVDGFATAVLQTVDGERALSNLEDELFRFSRVVAGSDELRAALSSRDLPAANRRALVTDLLQGKATDATVALATYATQVGRPRDFELLLDYLVTRVAAESNRRLAEVRAAVEMDDQQQRQLAEALGRALGHDVDVRVTVDRSVIAGFVATIGDTVVDASARHQLDILKERLVMPEASITTGQINTEERH
ncbi:MAG TPA: ATP synthase F1 subunit delta [Acidimicrobiales bacterium]|nr:ATP synthase F1 subunit delta [Acidimicrobiales bacterium]